MEVRPKQSGPCREGDSHHKKIHTPMDKRVSERVAKFNIISALCANNPSIVDSLPAFKANLSYLDTENAAIKKLMQPLLLPVTGTAEDKKAAKLKVAQLFDPLCGALMSYANKIKSAELKAASNFTVSAFIRTRDEDLSQTCYALHTLAKQHLEGIADFGYTEDDLKTAEEAVTAFEAYNPKPIENRSVDKAERENLLQRSWALNAFVGTQMKNTAKRFKLTQPEFYEQFMNAVRNQNRGIRHRLTDEEKALRKAIREQKAAEVAAARTAAREAESLANAAGLQAQLDALNRQAATEAKQPAEENGVPVA